MTLNKAIVCALFLCVSLASGQPLQKLALRAGGVSIRGIPPGDAGSSSKAVIPLPGDDVVPQIVNGTLTGGHFSFTQYQFINITDSLATCELRFFDDSGNPLTLPMVDLGPGTGGNFIGIATSIPARGSGVAVTDPADAPPSAGYAILESTPPGAILVNAIFNNKVPGSRAFQASVPVTTWFHQRFHLAFTNAAGFVTSLAVVARLPQTVTFIARAWDGTEMCRFSRFFSPGEHFAFLLRDSLPCTANAEGVLHVEGSQELGGMSAVGFMAADEGLGAFVTLPVWGPMPEL